MTVEFVTGYYLGREVQVVDVSPQGPQWLVGRFADDEQQFLWSFLASQVTQSDGRTPLDITPLQ